MIRALCPLLLLGGVYLLWFTYFYEASAASQLAELTASFQTTVHKSIALASVVLTAIFTLVLGFPPKEDLLAATVAMAVGGIVSLLLTFTVGGGLRQVIN